MNTVVVAAGASRRYGYANKLLAAAPHRPLIVETLDRVLTVTSGPVVLVVGHQSRPLIAALRRHRLWCRRLRIVRNPHARRGLATSLGQGLRAAVHIDTAISVHLADLPVFDRRIADQLRQALHHGALAARPMADGRPGHPVRMQRRILSLTSTAADAGLRNALSTLETARFTRIACAARFADDIDTRQMIRIRT